MLEIINYTSEEVDEAVFRSIFVSAQELLSFSGSLNLTLTTDSHIQELNKKYAQNDYATDVLSWAYQETNNLFDHEAVGEVVISLDTAKRQALSRQQSLTDELKWLFAHGLLHVKGYDHQDLVSKTEMDNLTAEIVNMSGQ